MAGARGNASFVTRTEIRQLESTVQDMANAVSHVTAVLETNSQQVDALLKGMSTMSTQVAQQGVPRGLSVPQVMSALGLIATWSGVLGALIVQHIDGKTNPLRDQLQRVVEEVATHSHLPAHPGTAARLATIEQDLRATKVESETQHRWMTDVANLQLDWIQRVNEMRHGHTGENRLSLPPPGYAPLRDMSQPVPGNTQTLPPPTSPP